jgi:hypothetical protein
MNLGFIPDTAHRELFSKAEELKLKIYEVIFKVFNRIIPIPWQIRRKVIFKLKGYNYPPTK